MNTRSVRNTIAVILVTVGVIALIQMQFGGGKSEAYEHTLPLERLQALDIVSDGLALEVNFVMRAGGSNAVQVEGQAVPEVIERIKSATVQNGKLSLPFKEKRRWRPFNFSGWNGWNEKQVITVMLTEEALASLESVKVSSDSGSIRVDGATAPEQAIRTDSGSIRLGELRGGRLTVKSDSGSIRLERYEGDDLSLATDSGSIQAGTVRANLQAASDSGSITVDRLAGYSEIKSDSGSIRVEKEDGSGATVTSDSGSVRLTVPSDYRGSYDLKSDSGSIHNPDPIGTSGELIKVRTDSGSIRIYQ